MISDETINRLQALIDKHEKLSEENQALKIANKTLREENEKLRKLANELERSLDHHQAGRFVGSVRRETFHRPSCRWAEFIMDSDNLIEFSSHEEAVAAGYKPCKGCCA